MENVVDVVDGSTALISDETMKVEISETSLIASSQRQSRVSRGLNLPPATVRAEKLS
jgi:hypothetical protein